MSDRTFIAITIVTALLTTIALGGEPEELTRDIHDCGKGEYRVFAGEDEGYRIQICRPVLPPHENKFLRLTLTRPDGTVTRLRRDILPEGGDISGQEIHLSGGRHNMLLRIRDGSTDYIVYTNIDWHVSDTHLTVEAGLVIEENGQPIERADLTAHHIAHMSPGFFEKMSIPLEGPERMFPVPGVNEEAAMEQAALEALRLYLEPKIRKELNSGHPSYLSAVRPWKFRDVPCRAFIWVRWEEREEIVLGRFIVDNDNRIYEWREGKKEPVHVSGSPQPQYGQESEDAEEDWEFLWLPEW